MTAEALTQAQQLQKVIKHLETMRDQIKVSKAFTFDTCPYKISHVNLLQHAFEDCKIRTLVEIDHQLEVLKKEFESI
jgi:hypothetical protein